MWAARPGLLRPAQLPACLPTEPRTLSRWIHGILARKLWERRAEQRDATYDDIDVVMESRFHRAGSWGRPPDGPVERLARGEFQEQLRSCLDTLPERHREAFTLREAEGFATGEVCKILGISGNNRGVILFPARNRLRDCLEAKGVSGAIGHYCSQQRRGVSPNHISLL